MISTKRKHQFVVPFMKTVQIRKVLLSPHTTRHETKSSDNVHSDFDQEGVLKEKGEIDSVAP